MSDDGKMPSVVEPALSASADAAAHAGPDVRLRMLVDGIRDYAIILLDPAGHIQTWNPGAEAIKGYRREEIVGRHFSVFYTPVDIARGYLDSELAEAAEHGRYEDEGWRVRKDGRQFWASVLITAVRDSGGELLGYGKVTRDLTERKLAQDALDHSAEQFRRVFDDAPTGLVITDPEGRFVRVNDAFCALVGYSEALLLDKGFLTLVASEDVPIAAGGLAELRSRSQLALSIDLRMLHQDGRTLWTRIHATTVGDHDKALGSLICHVQDLTERRRHEHQLLHLADHDPLTGLFNRRRIEQELESHMKRVSRFGPAGAVLILDLDNFKQINDALGHASGDQLLVQVADALRARLRVSDVLARLGGDEFALLLPAANRAETASVSESLLSAIRDKLSASVVNRRLTTSMGVALIDNDRLTAGELLVHAARSTRSGVGSAASTGSPTTGEKPRPTTTTRQTTPDQRSACSPTTCRTASAPVDRGRCPRETGKIGNCSTGLAHSTAVVRASQTDVLPDSVAHGGRTPSWSCHHSHPGFRTSGARRSSRSRPLLRPSAPG